MPEKRSPLQTVAFICVKLDEGLPEDKIKLDLDFDEYDDNLFSFCVEFALENNLLIKQENGKYAITNTGKEFASSFQSLAI